MDIRNFFSRKRKNDDPSKTEKDERLSSGPARKKRKISSNTDIVPSIKSLKLQKQQQPQTETETKTETETVQNTKFDDKENDDEQKCVSDNGEQQASDMDDEADDEEYRAEDDEQQDNDEQHHDDDDDEEEELEPESDEDADIDMPSTSNNCNKHVKATKGNKPKPNSAIPSVTLSKIKQSSLAESCKYDVAKDCGFTADKVIEYQVMADLFDKLNATTKRLEKIEMMSRLFRSILHVFSGDDKVEEQYQALLYAIYLCCNELGPPYEGIELGIGDGIILKALCESTGRKLRDIRAEYTAQGDLGDVAVHCRSKQNTLFKPKALTINNVFDTFKKIATTSGSGTQQEKVRNIQRLFVAAKSNESRYIVRHLQGKLRIGVNEQTVLAALGRAYAFNAMAIFSKSSIKSQKSSFYQKLADLEDKYTSIIKQCVSQLPNYEMIVRSLIKHGVEDLNTHCHLTAGIPIKAMLAKPTKGISEILKRFENMRFTLEYKYDGERAQIHLLPDGSIKIFSRNAEDNTSKFPELVATVAKFKKDNVRSFIIDSEIVAYDRVEDTILPFSTLMTRKRKNVNESEITVSICIYAFDCLLVNEQPLIELPFAKRRENLYKNFTEITGEFKFAHHKDTADSEEITEYLNQAVSVGKCEGLMIKTLDVDATYEPSKRSHNWLKCKKDYLDGIGDTLDLVVMGAFHGTGKRTGNYGSYLVGCYNEDEDTYESCCKVATGFSDDDLATLDKEMKQYLTSNEGSTKPIEYETSYACQVWFEPKCVWELKCADLTISPTHFAAAGLAHESKGIALRFPRYVRKRDDKQPSAATTSQQVFEMYEKQAILQ